jgi:hypothetical protein
MSKIVCVYEKLYKGMKIISIHTLICQRQTFRVLEKVNVGLTGRSEIEK